MREQKASHAQGSTKALSPKEAAAIIIYGTEKENCHIFTARDAQIMDKLYRTNPGFATCTVAKKMAPYFLPELH